VLGIGTDFTACTILPTLRDGTPLSTLPQYAENPHAWVKLWKHHAAQPEAVRINEIGAARNEPVMRMYNGRYSSEWFFSKVLQIVDEAPEIYAAAERIVEAADWIVWQMTGQLRANECTAGYKDMWTKGVGYPSKEFFRALDPRLENVAALTGLKAGTPVAVGNIDAHVAVPACGVVKPGVLCMIMGTSLCHMLMADEQHFVEGVAGVVEDGIVPGFWGYEAGQAAVGDIYAWFFRAFGANPDEVTTKAAKLKPGQSGLVALDWWNGNRSVLMDADLTGLIAGMTLGTQPEEIYRALIEATAFGTYTVIKAFEKKGVPIDQLLACGGLPQKSPLVMQIFADVTNRTIHLPRSLQASNLGAAMHGAVAAGVYKDIAEAASKMAGLQDLRYTPSAEAHAVYEKLYAEYIALHDYFGRGASDAMKRLKALKG
jgi:L-ribulokinase